MGLRLESLRVNTLRADLLSWPTRSRQLHRGMQLANQISPCIVPRTHLDANPFPSHLAADVRKQVSTRYQRTEYGQGIKTIYNCFSRLFPDRDLEPHSRSTMRRSSKMFSRCALFMLDATDEFALVNELAEIRRVKSVPPYRRQTGARAEL